MEEQDDFDIAALQVSPERMRQMLEQTREQMGLKPKQEWRRLYTMVPREWEARLLKAKRIGTYRLALELLYLHWRGRGKPVTISGKVAKAVGLSLRSKWRAISELEHLDLVEVTRRGGRMAPLATLRHVSAP